MTLLYAIGIGVLLNVLVAALGVLLRLLNAPFDPTSGVGVSAAIIVGTAAAVFVARHGLVRSDLLRLALLGLATHVSLLVNRVLGVAFTGRTPDDGSIDALLYTRGALTLLIGGLVLGTAIGLIARGFQPRIPWRPPEQLVRAAGFAFVAGTIVAVVWPAPFLAQLLAAPDLAAAALSIPLIVAGPLAGGAYAARAGVDYRRVALLGAYVTLPIFLTLVAGTVADVGRLSDPLFAAFTADLRVRIVLSWFLVALRLASWPLGAAFAEGFLSPATPRQTETAS